jgi:predicted Zn-ribbon and HTH transcriptional regulator
MTVPSVHGTRSEMLLYLVALLLVGPLVMVLMHYLKRHLKRRDYLARHWPGECAYCGYNVDDLRKPCPNCGKITDTTAE